MKILLKKMLRDFKDHKIQFLSIFLMAFLGVFAFTGISGEVVGLSDVSSHYYEDTNLADGWVYGEDLDNDTFENIKNMEEIKDAEREMVVNTVANYSSDPDITLHILEGKQKISKFYLFKGKDFDENDKDGIWIDKRFADARDLDIGDRITLKFDGKKVSKTIRGIVFSPEYVYYIQEGSLLPDFKQVGYAYISSKAANFDVEYNTITLDSYEELEEKDFKSDLYELMPRSKFVQFLHRDNNIGVKTLNEEINQHQMFSGVFPIIFVLVALLTLLTTMSRLISSQRTQIGALKAMGYSNKSIIYHYLLYGFFLSLTGSILGLIIGPMTIPRLFYPSMSLMYSLPHWGPAWNLTFFVVAALMVIFSVAVTFISVKSISDENPADSIKPKAPKPVSSDFIEKTKIWEKLSFNERWNYRDAKRNKVRAIMSIFGVFACALLIISAFGMYDSMNDVKDWQYEQIYQYSSKLLLNENITDSQLDYLLDETNGEGIMEEAIELKYKGNKKTGTLTVLNESELYKTTDINRNYIQLDPNGIAISDRMAEILGLEIGDKVRWHVVGNPKWIDSEITETYSIPFGQGIMMSPKVYEKVGGDDYNYSTNTILTKENISKNYTGVDSISTREDIVSGWDSITEAMNLMVFVLIFFAIVLAVVVLYNLGLLSFTEIQRELATLKVLGFNSRSLRRLLLTQNLWFSTIGFILSIPGAYLLMIIMMGSAGEDYYFPINIYLWNLLLSFILTFGLSVIVNLMFSRKIKKVNMVESLKSNE
ncbi:ABC transporter permease [Methanobrevibacter olleyae]|uniref:ABC transporter permease protein n=1 Tax=Methanobrevibacter olleyae TaxID=294671 RepID=A0A126R2H0_METOL|nr:ABC transporter permease [Methanobrevibacter olleyae]AMK16179.1 ABC transporter permease protein [Methanobrevibacter olleyae]SFL52638.1 putative ABC transport system permease protein [Methanobrevibacter olleyae]